MIAHRVSFYRLISKRITCVFTWWPFSNRIISIYFLFLSSTRSKLCLVWCLFVSFFAYYMFVSMRMCVSASVKCIITQAAHFNWASNWGSRINCRIEQWTMPCSVSINERKMMCTAAIDIIFTLHAHKPEHKYTHRSIIIYIKWLINLRVLLVFVRRSFVYIERFSKIENCVKRNV